MKLNKDRVVISLYNETEEVLIHTDSYSNGRPAIVLFYHNGEPYSKLTVNRVEEAIGENQFFIKNDDPEYSIACQMEEEGIIRRVPGDDDGERQADSGRVAAYATLWEACWWISI